MSGKPGPRVFLCRDSRGGDTVPASFEKVSETVAVLPRTLSIKHVEEFYPYSMWTLVRH